MSGALLPVLALCLGIATSLGADADVVKFSSPDGRFALRFKAPESEETVNPEVDLIDEETGRMMVRLGFSYRSHVSDTVLVWSADSRWAAFSSPSDRDGDASVYFWDGAAFNELALPKDTPTPNIKFHHNAGGRVKNYGGAVKPLRWLKPGLLELSAKLTMLSRVDERTYTGILRYTVAFDAKHHSSVKSVGKTKTVIDE